MRSLSSPERLLDLTQALEKIEYDIIGLAEVRRTGCKIEEHQDFILCYKGETKGLHGVGFLIKKTLKQNIIDFIGISERVALLKLKFKNQPITIIQAYAPTERAKEDEMQKFYDDLKNAQDTQDTNVLVIGDFNAKIGQPRKFENLIMGKYGYGKRNERGEWLLQYAREQHLSIMNTYFKKKQQRRWTWVSPDNKTKNEIDYILCNKPKQITNVEVLNKLSFPSDHRLLRSSFLLEAPKKSRKAYRSLPKPPTTEQEKTKYLQHLNDNLITYLLNKKHTNTQTYYDNLETAITSSLKINKDEQKKKKILRQETIELVNKRTELLAIENKSKEIKSEIKKIFKKTNKAIKKDYRSHRQETIKRNLVTYRSSKRAYKELKSHKDWIQKLQNQERETKNRKDVITHATNFYQDLYKKPDKEPDNTTFLESKQNNQDIVEPISELEISKHISHLKPEKSPGPDNISNEALKIGAPLLVPYLAQLYNMVLEQETVPKQWCSSDIILLYKKGNPLDVSNYRPISLLSSVYKLFTSILQTRLTPSIDAHQPIEQAGFRSGYSTIDHIHTLDQVMGKYIEYNYPLYIAFIDYSKAFDSITHSSIWRALKTCEINQTYINILINIYSQSVSRVKMERKGEEIAIGKGVRQGDPISPKLFIAVLEQVFKNIQWKNKGISILNKRLTHLRFADDIIIFAESATQLEDMMNTLDKESKKVGLHMNTSKTKAMTNSRRRLINVAGTEIDYVNEYIYLGKHISFSPSNNEEEVDRRINTAWKKFWSQKEILKGEYSIAHKKIVMDTCILPSLTYGSQTWTYTKKVRKAITTCQRSMERSILNIRKIQKIRSEIIRQKTKLTDALQQALHLKWQWAGHVARYKDKRWTLVTTKWTGPAGRRLRRRPKKKWIDDIYSVAGKDWLQKAKDRDEWRKSEEAFTQQMGSAVSPKTNLKN